MSDKATSPSTDAREFTPEQVKIIKEQIAPDLTESELAYFLEVCKTRRLNPILKQVYAIKRNVKVKDKQTNQDRWEAKLTIQTSIDAFRLIAERTERYAGRERQVWCGKEGRWLDVWLSSDPPSAAMVGVNKVTTVGISATTAVAKWSEFAQTYNDKPTGMWAKMPASQLSKCAEAQALRAAFPEELGGLYTDDEMAQADNPAPTAAHAPTQPPAQAQGFTQPRAARPEAPPPPPANGKPKVACPKCGKVGTVFGKRNPQGGELPFFCATSKGGCGKGITQEEFEQAREDAANPPADEPSQLERLVDEAGVRPS